MYFADALTLDAPRRTSEGFLAVRARAAKAGVYQYTGREVDPTNAHGLRDQASVNVLREPEQVFDERAVHSFLMKPITDDHPTEAVTATNWRDHARGTVAKAMRDGDNLAFDLILMDAHAIAQVDAGKVELSNGYGCKLDFGDFTAADGTKCAARQTNIVGNHVALVDRGRAGPTCRIGDAATCDALPSTVLKPAEKPVKTMLIDGLTVDIANADTAQATITTILAARDAATAKVAGLETQVAALTTDKATLTAEKATLEQQVKDASAPDKLRDAAKAYALTADKAKALGVNVTDAMDEAAIRRAVVDAKVAADLRQGWTDAQYSASFAVLTADVKPATGNIVSLHAPINIGDAASRENAALTKANDHNAWRTAGAA